VFFRFLVDSDYLFRDPARLVRYARVQHPPARAMTNVEVDRLLKTIGKDRAPSPCS
jgi:site-specific recombinase XerD